MVGQSALGATVFVIGLVGSRWPQDVRSVLVAVGIAVGAAGLALFVGGIAALGGSLTPFPTPSERATLRVGGAYRLSRHPIYGGLLLVALGWSLALSPLALVPTALLVLLLELKSRHEETLLVERYPDYADYRRRVRWRFVPGVR